MVYSSKHKFLSFKAAYLNFFLDHFDNSATEETECVADGNTSTNFNNSVEEDMSCSSTNELPFVTSLDAGSYAYKK